MILTATLALAPFCQRQRTGKRLNEAARLSEITTPDKAILEDLLANAHRIVIVPD
jgi:hypothetical protein